MCNCTLNIYFDSILFFVEKTILILGPQFDPYLLSDQFSVNQQAASTAFDSTINADKVALLKI